MTDNGPSMLDGDPWLNMPASTYQADGFAGPVFFAARSLGEKGGLRVVPRVRPWQRAAKLDETGAEPDEFTLELIFHNDVTEESWSALQLQNWPKAIEELIKQFKSGKTGTLHLPWKRNLRVKPVTWDRRASADEHRGGEILTVTFKEDNEDDLDREAFEVVSVKAAVGPAVQEAIFDAESIGAWGDPLADIQELASAVEGYLNAPGEYAQAVLTAAKRLRRAARTVMDALSTNAPGRNQLLDPTGASLRLKLLDILELSSRAEGEARSILPRTRTVTFPRVRDIWTIATELRQSARDLMGINGHIEDFAVIPAGTPVHVFAE